MNAIQRALVDGDRKAEAAPLIVQDEKGSIPNRMFDGRQSDDVDDHRRPAPLFYVTTYVSPSIPSVELTGLRRAGVPIYYDHERARNNNYEDYLEQTHGTKSQPCVVS